MDMKITLANYLESIEQIESKGSNTAPVDHLMADSTGVILPIVLVRFSTSHGKHEGWNRLDLAMFLW